jgi:PAS domain S-box-containing protein
MNMKDYTEQDHTEDCEALRQALLTMVSNGLTSVDAPFALEFMADEIIGIGMGEQGFYKNKDELQVILETLHNSSKDAQMGKTPPKLVVGFGEVGIHFISPDVASMNAEIFTTVEINGKPARSGIIQMACAKKTDGKWRFFMMAAAPLALSVESIETYPLAFADHALAQLKGELQTETFDLINKSFSGGILGTYVRDGYPLYFANDTIIGMLGYERAEFEEKFKNSTMEINYTDDREAMEEYSLRKRQTTEDFGGRFRWLKKDGSIIWVENRIRKTKDNFGNDVFLHVCMDITEIINLQHKMEEQSQTIRESIIYASKIQRNLLPRDAVLETAFTDHSIIWKPRDIVGGDIYWAKQFDKGTVLCVSDCTGHSTPGALLTMLVISALESIVWPSNCDDTAGIILQLDRRLAETLNVDAGAKHGIMDIDDGCDLAVLFIAKDGSVTFSSGNFNVFVCDGRGVQRFKGQKIFVGEGKLINKDEVEVCTVPANPNNKFYIASDGLYEQPGGGHGKSFGLKTLLHVMLEYHNEKQSVITEKIWAAFEEYRGAEPRVDDFELIAFKP